MKKKRRWSRLPKRLLGELNSVSGLAGVGGTAIGIGGAAVAGITGTVILSSGAVIAIGAFGYAAYRAIPPVLSSPQDLVGRSVNLSELQNVSPRILRLAVVGPSRSGKTTLKQRLSVTADINERTREVSAHIIALQSPNSACVAVLDGGGERLAQQFRIAEHADCLCLVIDHNDSDVDPTIDQARLNEHTEFLRQVRHHLEDSGSVRKQWVEILANKSDLWRTTEPRVQERFENFYRKEEEHWATGRFAVDVSSNPHSNERASDIARFMSKLVSTVSSNES